jgi:hypothetical protein
MAPHLGHVLNFCGVKSGQFELPIVFKPKGFDQIWCSHLDWTPQLDTSRTPSDRWELAK